MPYLIAIEHDSKCYKDISESLSPMLKELGHELLMFESLADFKTEFTKPEHATHSILLLIISLEEAGAADPTPTINSLKSQYKCDVLLSMFEDPLKPFKKPEKLPVQNILYKPFDATILKEHTRFALQNGQKIKTMFVHTTQVNTQIEMMKKFRITDLAEFGMKVDKRYQLEKNQVYKFYHPLFTNKKLQHVWGRVVNETPEYYELLFCQTVPAVLAQIRKKVAASAQKVKSPSWVGITENNKAELKIALQLADEALVSSLQELLSRNFKNLSFITGQEIDPKQKIQADVFITETTYDKKMLEAQFEASPLVMRLYDTHEAPARADLEELFKTEFLRIEKPVDRAALVKNLKLFFPNLEENDEKIQLITVNLDEICSQSEVIQIQEFSEAAILFTDPIKYELNQIVDIALPHDDELSLQEIKAKIHFSSERPDTKKLYEQQFVLFGMKDEYLKLLRLWALQKHIEKNKKGA